MLELGKPDEAAEFEVELELEIKLNDELAINKLELDELK